MNKKSIFNRMLPLIIALAVIIVVAICVTVFSADKANPSISNPDQTYVKYEVGKSDFGYNQEIDVKKGEVYDSLKVNGGLASLVNKLDKEALSKTKNKAGKSYYDAAKEDVDAVNKAVEEAIFSDGYKEEDYTTDEEIASAGDSVKNYIKNMKINNGIDINASAVDYKDGKLTIDATKCEALFDYYVLILAKKAYTRDEIGNDQVEAFEKYIKAYAVYLAELYKYNNDEIDTAPKEPTSEALISSSSVESNYTTNNNDSYWAIFTKYNSKDAAEKALLQVGVKIVSVTKNGKSSNVWFEYQGIDPSTNEPFNDDYYKNEENNVHQYTRNEILLKMVELYNNSVKLDEEKTLKENVHYSIKTIKASEYEKLSDTEKSWYENTGVKDSTGEEDLYEAVIFEREIKLDADGEVDKENTLNTLYWEKEDITSIDSSILTWLKSLNGAYTENASWDKSYTTSIQSRGSYYIIGAKLSTVTVDSVEDAIGVLYDKDAFKKDGSITKFAYGIATVDNDGNVTFNYENNKYWEKVVELLDGQVTSTNIDAKMAKLRNDLGLIIYDDDLETSYMSTYTSDYKATKKSNKEIVAKLSWKDDEGKHEFTVTANDLYESLEKVSGAMTAIEIYRYQYMLYSSDVIDYAKYVNGSSLKDSVIITEYALANKGSKEPITSWTKVSSDATVTFEKMDGSKEYDVLVRTRTDKKDSKVEVSDLVAKVKDKDSKKSQVTVVVSNDADFQDNQTMFEGLNDQIEALKIYFTNGNFANYGFDASYGWKNFIRDYFRKYYGIKVETNDDLKLYYIYEDATTKASDAIAELTEEDWNNVYLPYMQQTYDNYFSVDAIHFLISIDDKDGNKVDLRDAENMTAAQKEAIETLYKQVVTILKNTRKDDQKTVLDEIVDAFDSAPNFILGKGNTTEEQEQYIKDAALNGNKLYWDAKYNDTLIKYTKTIKGVTIKVSEYKNLGISVKTEDLGTVAQGKMVEEFENALKQMWQDKDANDEGMAKGEALVDNVLYDDYIDNSKGEYLITEYGYHVLIANKFTARSVSDKKVLKLPTLEEVRIYESDDPDKEELTDFQEAQIKAYYTNIKSDFESSYKYQMALMNNILADVNSGKFNWADDATTTNLVETIKYLIEQYYSGLSYIKNDYTTAINYMNIAINAKTSYDAGHENISAENLATIIADAKNAIAKVNLTSGDYNKVQVKEFEELKAKFEALVK